MADEQQNKAAEAQVIGQLTPEQTADFLAHPRRVFIDGLKTFFSEPEMLGGPNPYRWSQDKMHSKIVIAAEYTEEQDIKNPNHMILVNRGPVRFSKTHWRNLQQERVSPFLRKPTQPGKNEPGTGGTEQKAAERQRLGRSYSALAQADIQILCFSRKPAEAEVIASAATVLVMMQQDLIKQRAKIHRMENPVVGNESPVQSADAQIMLSVVPITIPIWLNISWMTVRDPEEITVEPIITHVDDC